MIQQYFLQQCRLNIRDYPRLLFSLLFFGFIVFMFPVLTVHESQVLTQLAPGVIWFAALFAHTLTLTQYFNEDYHSGLLELLCMSPYSLSLLLLLRSLAHTLCHLIPLLSMVLVTSVVYQLSVESLLLLSITLTLGLPVLDLLGALMSALLLNSRQGSILLLILLLPLYIPIVILSTASITAVNSGLPIIANLSLLTAVCCLAITFIPPLLSYGLRVSMES